MDVCNHNTSSPISGTVMYCSLCPCLCSQRHVISLWASFCKRDNLSASLRWSQRRHALSVYTTVVMPRQLEAGQITKQLAESSLNGLSPVYSILRVSTRSDSSTQVTPVCAFRRVPLVKSLQANKAWSFCQTELPTIVADQWSTRSDR